jgi:hypothetical protein
MFSTAFQPLAVEINRFNRTSTAISQNNLQHTLKILLEEPITYK